MNRHQLFLAIMAWIHRAALRTPIADAFDVVGSFVMLCEQDLNARLRARCMIGRTSITVTGQYTPTPADYLEPEDLRLADGSGPELTYVTRGTAANALWQASMSNPGAVLPPDYYPILNPPAYPWGDGNPRHFSVIGADFEWSPFPVLPEGADPDTYAWPVVEVAYFQRLALGPADTDTNAVLTKYPAAYIYGSLIHASPFLRDDSRVNTWKAAYESAIGGANAEAERARTQNTPIRAQYRRLA